MKTHSVICFCLLVTSTYSSADEFDSADYNTTISFNEENRIALDGGSSGWYFAPHIGYNMISNSSTEGVTIKYANGISFGGGFGVEVKQDLAFQFDFGYIRNDVDRMTNDGTGNGSEPDIEFTQIPLMFNLIWSPSNQPDIKPYFGLGIGAIRGKYESNAFVSSDAEWALAGEFRIGLKIDLSTTSNLTLGYQFTLAQYDDNIDNHTLGLGFEFRF